MRASRSRSSCDGQSTPGWIRTVRRQLRPSRRGTNDGSQIRGEGRHCTWAATLASEKTHYRYLPCALGRNEGIWFSVLSAQKGPYGTAKKEAPRRALVMKQVAGQVGVNRPADSINSRHAQRFPEPPSAGVHWFRAPRG